MALTHGEGAVGKVHEHFAALEVVGGDGVGGVAFWGVGEYEDAEVVTCFEGFELFHEGECLVGGAERAAVAQATDVIDDEHLRAGLLHGIFDGGIDVLLEIFEVGGHLCFEVELGTVKVLGEIVGGVAFVIARPELVGAELEIDIQYFLRGGVVGEGLDGRAAGYLMTELHGEDGFAEVGVGEEDA